MKPNIQWTDALEGTTFSSAQEFLIEKSTVTFRSEFLTEAVEGRRVIHVGCVDHLELIDEKVRRHQWLHQILCESAERCLGVDINVDGIDTIKRMGWTDVVAGDITVPSAFLDDADPWDLLVLGEILEHVDNPVDFLAQVRAGWEGRCDRMIITVPNAFAWPTVRSVLRSREDINTDHRFWFTPFTAAKVATRAGWVVESITLCESFPYPRRGPLHKRLKRAVLLRWLQRNPLMRTSVVLTMHSGRLEPEGVPAGTGSPLQGGPVR